MGKKNKQNNGEARKEGENKNKESGGGKNNVTVALKADLHCDGCASKVIKCIRSFDGVDTVKVGEDQKITVVGKVDPVKLREAVEQKTHKKVELISPKPNKDGNNAQADKENTGGGKAKPEKKKESKGKDSNDKNSKEPPVTTAVLKVNLHCDGCIKRIRKTVTKTRGYQEIKIDMQKDLVTVTGAMDMKALAEELQKQLKKDVQIVPPKKEGEKKEKSSGGDKGKSGDDESGGGGVEKMEWNKMPPQMFGYPYPYPYSYPYPYPYSYPFTFGQNAVVDQFHYNPYVVRSYPAPQMFSDENPNACSIL